MYTVIGTPLSPFVRKVILTLLEKQLSFNINPTSPCGFPGAAENLLEIAPQGQIPALWTGEYTIGGSTVISLFLDRHHPSPPLYPRDDIAFADTFWLELFANDTLGEVITFGMYFPLVILPGLLQVRANQECARQVASNRLPGILDTLESRFGNDTWLVDNTFSAADISIGAQLLSFEYLDHTIDSDRWPKSAAWYNRFKERPSVQQALAQERALQAKGPPNWGDWPEWFAKSEAEREAFLISQCSSKYNLTLSHFRASAGELNNE